MVSDDVKLRHFYWPQSPVEKSTYGPVMANNKRHRANKEKCYANADTNGIRTKNNMSPSPPVGRGGGHIEGEGDIIIMYRTKTEKKD